MRTAVVILNWNTEGFLRDFLPGLESSVKNIDGAEVIVADNASTDGSMAVMKEQFPHIKTLSFEKNLGFTGGYNKAFEIIDKEYGPEYFLLINSDIEVTEGWLRPLIGWMDRHPECGACAPKLHSYFEKDRFEYAGAAGGYIDRLGYPFCRGRVLKRIEQDHGQYDCPAEVMWATGACLMVRSSVYRHIGGLDDRFFAHMEEIDLCWRMQLEGWKVTIVPESVVYHVGGGTLPQTSPFKLYLNFRNNLLMLENNLAITLALDYIKKGHDKEVATEKGLSKARRIIFERKCMDGLAAAMYLLTFRWSFVKAVWKAHKDYRKLRTRQDAAQVRGFLEKCRPQTQVNGRYGKSIIFQSMIKGKGIFDNIQSDIV